MHGGPPTVLTRLKSAPSRDVIADMSGSLVMHHCVLYSAKTYKPFDRAVLAQLLGAARVRNESAGITGILLYGRSTVMQCLEGPPAEVEKVLDRIRRDPRIYDIRIEASRSNPQRLFPGWSMAYDHGSDAQALADTLDLRSLGALPESEGRFDAVLTMLRNFRDGVVLHDAPGAHGRRPVEHHIAT